MIRAMSKKEARELIIDLCYSTEGFVYELRIDMNFNQEKYETLVMAIKGYTKAIEHERQIDRMVAGALFHLVTQLWNLKTVFRSDGREHKMTNDALGECLNLSLEMLEPQWYWDED